MKVLHIQIQPSLSPNLDIRGIVKRIKVFADLHGAEFREAGDGPTFLNINLETDNVSMLWSKFAAEFIHPVDGERLRNASIIACEGEDGWNDYLLLHHFDKSEELDKL